MHLQSVPPEYVVFSQDFSLASSLYNPEGARGGYASYIGTSYIGTVNNSVPTLERDCELHKDIPLNVSLLRFLLA